MFEGRNDGKKKFVCSLSLSLAKENPNFHFRSACSKTLDFMLLQVTQFDGGNGADDSCGLGTAHW